MAPTISLERRSYRDASPTTPLTPLSPSALPRWLRHTRQRTGVLASGRFRLILIASVCVVLGWMLTSVLGPADIDVFDDDAFYDAASGGILEDPTGFGHHSSGAAAKDGFLGETEPPEPTDTGAGSMQDKEVSVTGALADLHHAVKIKIQAWNPYASKPARPDGTTPKANLTTPYTPQATNLTASTGEDVKDGIGEAERLGARVRIGKCTILFDGNSWWERAIRTHEQHDRQHGYRLHVLRQHLMDDVWSKPAYILSLLLRELAKPESERLEWLFWVDADTIILNPYIPIDVFLPPPGSEFENIHLMYSNDWNGLNNGVFPVRVNQWSVQLFSAITSFRHYRPEQDLIFRDQSAMDMLMREPAFMNNIVQAPQRWFNAYQGEHNETLAPFQIRRGDFLVHFAGVPDREARMGYWLDRAEQHLDDWEIPVKSTSYLQEVRDFWSEQRALRQQQKETLAAVKSSAKESLSKIEQDLTDYGDRLGEDQKSAIQAYRDELNLLLEPDNSEGDAAKINALLRGLTEAAQPLTAAMSGAQKLLLKSAHEAIFAAEKDLLENGYGKGTSDPDLDTISEAVQRLKQLVMMPQEHWNRHDIIAATNQITEARSPLQSSLRSLGKAAGSPSPGGELGYLQPADHAPTEVAAPVTIVGEPVVVTAPVAPAEVASEAELEALGIAEVVER